MIERCIKELSIALEAISRVNTFAAVNMADDITDLLKAAIDEAKEQNKRKKLATTTDDDIPF